MRLIFPLIVFTLFGCALAPKVVHLDPLPTGSEARFAKPVCVKVAEFTDARENPQLLGHTFLLGIKTSDVKTYGDVPEWIRAAYKRELLKAGAQECETSPNPLVVAGTVKEVVQAESWNVDSTIRVEVKLSGGGEESTQSFAGNSSQTSHAASESEFTDSLYKALQDLMKRSVPAIIAAAR